jgi:Holliday junction resolvase
MLDGIEEAVRGIAQPVDNAAVFQYQLQYVLDRAGFYVIREVPMTELRRLDLVAIRGGITAAIEVDKCNPLRRSYGKMLDLPEDILRVVVLRRRLRNDLRVAWADRCIAVRSHLRMVSWLCDGRVTDMQSMADIHLARGELVPLREEVVVAPRTRGNAGSRR